MRPHAFLFNGDDPQVLSTGLDDIVRHFFSAILRHARMSSFDVRLGTLPLTDFTYRISGVERHKIRGAATIGHTMSDDKNFRKTLALDFADSATALWSHLDVDALTWTLLTHNVECISVSDLDPGVRETVHRAMTLPSYLGAFEIDRGNMMLRELAANRLPAYYRYENGVLNAIAAYGEEAEELHPHWADDLEFVSIGATDDPAPPIAPTALSPRGEKSVALFRARGQKRHAEKVLTALLGQWEADRKTDADEAVRFGSPEKGVPFVDVRKLTGYVLNEEHPKGKAKAVLFRKLLGITKRDWRFLAEQLVAGLDREAIQRARKEEHGVKYHVHVPVVGRNGTKKLVEAAWIIERDKPPRLVTAYPADQADTTRPAALEAHILPAGGKPHWQAIYDAAHGAGEEAAENWTPTPMFLAGGSVVSEGECGTAWVRLADGRSSFARWLQKQHLADRGYPRGVYVFSKSPSQSVERAIKYCEAFASVLRAHGIDCEVGFHLD